MYEFGGDLTGVVPQIDLYYSFTSKHLKMLFVSFPRRDLTDYPLFMLTDSLNYYRPNIEGSFIQYSWEWGTIHGWVDWTGRATEEIRESIFVGLDATLTAGRFYFKPTTTRYHMAHTLAVDDATHIRDDGAIALIAGVDISDLVPLDFFSLSSGSMSTYMQARPADYVWAHGWLSELNVKHAIAGFKGTYYKGGPSPLIYGDHLYRSGHYGRIDIYVEPFSNPRIAARFGCGVHLMIGDRVFHSQQVLIHIKI